MKLKALTILVALAGLAVGCAGEEETRRLPEIPGDDVEDVREESITSMSTTMSATSTTTTTTSTTTTSTTTTTLDPAALIVVGQFPGVNFPAASLPTEAGSVNNNRAGAESEKDQALIGAFVSVVNAAIAVNQDPSNVGPYDLAPMVVDLREAVRNAAMARTEANETLDMSGGLTVRPFVVEQEDPNLGLVWDCSIDGTVWRDAATGEPAAPSTGWPQVGAPGVEEGVGYLFELVDGAWLLSSVFTEPGACG